MQNCQVCQNSAECVVYQQVHISHVGQMRFKGVAEVQSVMQFSTAHLAARQFPTDPPSTKADLVKPFLAVHTLNNYAVLLLIRSKVWLSCPHACFRLRKLRAMCSI